MEGWCQTYEKPTVKLFTWIIMNSRTHIEMQKSLKNHVAWRVRIQVALSEMDIIIMIMMTRIGHQLMLDQKFPCS